MTSTYTLSLSADLEKSFSAIASKTATSKSELIKRALATYAFLNREMEERKGAKVLIAQDDGSEVEEVEIP